MVMRWFRRNEKILLAGLVVILMLAWGVLPTVAKFASRASERRGEIRGKTVTVHDIRTATTHLEELMRLDETLKGGLGLLTGADPISNFIFQGASPLSTRGGFTFAAAWRYLVLLREAEYAGIVVHDEEVAQIPAPSSDARLALENWFKILKLYLSRYESTQVSEPGLWMDYSYNEARVKLRFVALKPGLFVPLMEATTEEVKAFYEEHKNVLPDPETGTVGYKLPVRVRLDYALAPLEEFKKRVSVSDKEIQSYYEEHKSDFLVPEEKPAEQESQEHGAPTKEKPAPESSKAQHARGQEGPEKAEQKKEPRYKPLPEVKDAIREELLLERAAEAAKKAIDSVLDDLTSVSDKYVNAPLPLEQMARRYRVVYKSARADSRELLARQEVETLLPDGPATARRVFDEKVELNFPSFMQTSEGPMVFQVLQRRESEIRPFEQVESRVRQDLLLQKALGKAEIVGKKFIEDAKTTSFEQAFKETNDRLEKLLGPGDVKAVAPAQPGEKEEQAAESEHAHLLKIEETDFFTRSSPRIPQMEGDVREVVRKAFTLEGKQFVAVVEKGALPACYVIQKVEEKPAQPEKFYESKQLQMQFALLTRRQILMRGWMQSLLKTSPVPETEPREQ